MWRLGEVLTRLWQDSRLGEVLKSRSKSNMSTSRSNMSSIRSSTWSSTSMMDWGQVRVRYKAKLRAERSKSESMRPGMGEARMRGRLSLRLGGVC